MVRQDTVCAMRSDASLRSRSRSAGGTFSITSTAPASSASTRRIARHRTETHFVPCGGFVPVTVEARQLHAVAARPAYELERSTADHRLARIEVSGRRFERDVLRYDHDRIEILRQRAVWRRCLQAYG